MKIQFLIHLVLAVFVVSCSSVKKNTIEIKQENVTAEQLYEQGKTALRNNDLKLAVKCFSRVAEEFPYHEWASKAEVMEIYTNYLMAEYDNVIIASEQFARMHPASPDLPYILYLKAMSYYEQIDIPYRDQEPTRKAKQAFLELIKRFPESEYAKDIKIKLDLVNDHLAAHEMIVGRYYLSNGSILAAINRFNNVVSNYNTTNHIQEALYRLTEAYIFLGLKKEAQRNAAVLGYNYPTSKWYKESYNIINN